MAFDIYQLDQVDYDAEGEQALEAYQDALLEEFYKSPEGQALMEAQRTTEIGFWAAQLMYYGYGYIGTTIPKMTIGDLDEIVTELFPRKISLSAADEADDAIPELIAFWQFLKRVYQLPRSDEFIKFFRKVEPEFKTMMMDPANFGMAKSFFMMGQASGYDMTNPEDTNRFMHQYNAKLATQFSDDNDNNNNNEDDDILSLLGAGLPGLLDGPPQRSPLSSTSRAKKKKTRKMAKASRKKNRKKRK